MLQTLPSEVNKICELRLARLGVYRECRRHRDASRRLLIYSFSTSKVSCVSTFKTRPGYCSFSGCYRCTFGVPCPAFTRQLFPDDLLDQSRRIFCLDCTLPAIDSPGQRRFGQGAAGNGMRRVSGLLNLCLIMSDTGDSLLVCNGTSALHFNPAGVLQELVAVRGSLSTTGSDTAWTPTVPSARLLHWGRRLGSNFIHTLVARSFYLILPYVIHHI